MAATRDEDVQDVFYRIRKIIRQAADRAAAGDSSFVSRGDDQSCKSSRCGARSTTPLVPVVETVNSVTSLPPSNIVVDEGNDDTSTLHGNTPEGLIPSDGIRNGDEDNKTVSSDEMRARIADLEAKLEILIRMNGHTKETDDIRDLLDRNMDMTEKFTKLANHCMTNPFFAGAYGKRDKFLDQIFKENIDVFPQLPDDCNATTMADWDAQVRQHLTVPPWALGTDGLSILDVTDSDRKSSNEYKARVQQFGKTLYALLDKANLAEMKTVFRNSGIKVANGIVLFQEILTQLVPTTEIDILDALDDLKKCKHGSGEGIDQFVIQLQQIFDRIDRLGYVTIKDLQVAYLQRGFLRGAYEEHESLGYLQDKLANSD